MASVGDRLELEITDLGHDGQGVGRHDGQVVFVSGALPGDTVQVRLQAVARRHLVGQLQRVLTPSPTAAGRPASWPTTAGAAASSPWRTGPRPPGSSAAWSRPCSASAA
jgi:23S rRNA (uracil1939-C5)-methyltransferase